MLGRAAEGDVDQRGILVRRLHHVGDEAYDDLRTSVPQGCTGLWQVSCGTHGRVSDHPEYDEFYVEQQNLRLDLWILWRTLTQTLGGRSIDFDDIPRFVLRDPDCTRTPVAS